MNLNASHACRVSVVMPAYNAEPYINKAIDSILNQTYGDIELLVCNDCSTDKTGQIIEQYDDKRIKIFHHPINSGYLCTTNYLLEKAKGDLITFQDADDWSHCDRIENLVSAFEGSDIGACFSDSYYTDSGGKITGKTNLPGDGLTLQKMITSNKAIICAATLMIKKEVYQTIGGFRQFFDRVGAEDLDLIYRIIEKYNVVCFQRPLYFYRRHKKSLSNTIDGNFEKKIIYSKIALYLHHQRVASGVDYLEQQNELKLKELVEQLSAEIYDTPSILYGRMANLNLENGQYAELVENLLTLLRMAPIHIKTYVLIGSLIAKALVGARMYNKIKGTNAVRLFVTRYLEQ